MGANPGSRRLLDQTVDAARSGDGGRAFLRIMRGFERTVEKEALYRSVVGDSSRPRLVLWGANDPTLRLRPLGELAADVAGVPVQTVPGRHFLQEDNAPAIADAVAERTMPGARWFPGARLNFAQRCLAAPTRGQAALVCVSETGEPVEISWDELRNEVAAVAALLRSLGVRPGDHIAAYLPNIGEAVVALLATAAVGGLLAGLPTVRHLLTVRRPYTCPSAVTVSAGLKRGSASTLAASNGARFGVCRASPRISAARLNSASTSFSSGHCHDAGRPVRPAACSRRRRWPRSWS